MPFDPTKPAHKSDLSSEVVRGQLVALRDLIDTIPQGPQGAPGISVAAAVVDAVTTVNPGDPATAAASFDGATVHLSFGIPRGAAGLDGAVGAQGPVFTNFLVEATNTLPVGQPASVSMSFDGTAMRLTFGIPVAAPIT